MYSIEGMHAGYTLGLRHVRQPDLAASKSMVRIEDVGLHVFQPAGLGDASKLPEDKLDVDRPLEGTTELSRFDNLFVPGM
jgi:hypothetical protein